MKKGKIKSNQTNIFVSGHLRRQLARGLWFSTLPQVKMLQQWNLETSSNFHTFLFQVDQMAPGLAWQKIPMILSLYLPILKQKSTWAHPAGRVPGLHSGSPAAAMLVWESWGQQLQGLSQPRQEPAQACCCPWQPGMSFSNTLHPLTRSFSSWVFLTSGKNTFCWPVSLLGIHLPPALLVIHKLAPNYVLDSIASRLLGNGRLRILWRARAKLGEPEGLPDGRARGWDGPGLVHPAGTDSAPAGVPGLVMHFVWLPWRPSHWHARTDPRLFSCCFQKGEKTKPPLLYQGNFPLSRFLKVNSFNQT